MTCPDLWLFMMKYMSQSHNIVSSARAVESQTQVNDARLTAYRVGGGERRPNCHQHCTCASVAAAADDIAVAATADDIAQSPPLRATLHSRSHCGRHCSRRHGLPRRISKNVMKRRRSMACVCARTSMISKHPCELHSENSGGHLHPKSAQGWLKTLGAPLRGTQP